MQIPATSISDLPFRVESIDEVPAPSGTDGVWYRYVISQGTNTIVGTRSGSRYEVGIALDEQIIRLNERFGKQFATVKR